MSPEKMTGEGLSKTWGSGATLISLLFVRGTGVDRLLSLLPVSARARTRIRESRQTLRVSTN